MYGCSSFQSDIDLSMVTSIGDNLLYTANNFNKTIKLNENLHISNTYNNHILCCQDSYYPMYLNGVQISGISKAKYDQWKSSWLADINGAERLYRKTRY